MGFADFHIHSVHSFDGTATIPAILKYTADHTDLNVIAITDHNSMRGVRTALALAPRYGIEVIPGCEVSTRDGHLLALYINRPIRPGLPLVDTVLEVGAAGGICVAAHPGASAVDGLKFETIQAALRDPRVRNTLVGVEAFNGCLISRHKENSRRLSAELPLAQCGSSDAHTVEMIGSGATHFEGRTARDLRAALLSHSTAFRQTQDLSALQIIANYLPRIALRGLGWALWNEGPQLPLTLVRFVKTLRAANALGTQ